MKKKTEAIPTGQFNAIESILDEIEWQALNNSAAEDDLPYATHQGVLQFGEFKFTVYQLNDGRRVIDSKDLDEFFT
jgi:hypothetical protein